MSRRRTNSNSVSLFPFLAVLLCAMGALLFLLIAATRMIRDETVQKSAIASTPIPDSQPLQLLPELEEVSPKALTPAEIQLGIAERFPEPDRPAPPPLAAPKPNYLIHEPEPLPDLSAKIAALRKTRSSLEESRRALETEIDQHQKLQARKSALEAEIDLRQQVLNKADATIREMKQSLARNAAQLTSLQTRQKELERSEKQLADKLQISKSLPRSVANPLKIVPYEGKAGTTRRPLILECRRNSIVFLPEEVELTEKDLLGFTTKVNPLLTGVRALDRYWTLHDGQQGVARRPYVLIVVRPEGIPAYYAVRQLLSEYDQAFGYELLDHDQTLSLEAADSKASQVLNASVEQVLARRAEFATSDESPFALPEQRDSTGTSENHFVTNERETPETGPRASSKRPSFRMTPRGLEVISPDEEPEEPLFPSPARPRTSPSAASNNLARTPQSSSSNPPVPLKELGVSNSTEIPKPAEENHQKTSTARKQSSESNFPDLHELEPIEGDRNSAASSAPLLPENPLLSSPSASGTASSSRGSQGPPQPVLSDGKIRFQRELTVVLGLNELRVGYGDPIPLAEGISTRELLTLVVNQLRDETTAWGAPPGHLAWKPVVRFVLQPGGFQHYERIRPYFEKHKLIDSVGFEFAGVPTDGEQK